MSVYCPEAFGPLKKALRSRRYKNNAFSGSQFNRKFSFRRTLRVAYYNDGPSVLKSKKTMFKNDAFAKFAI